MRTTLNLDPELVEEARQVTGIRRKTDLVYRGLRELIARRGSLKAPSAERAPVADYRSPPTSDQRERPNKKWRATEAARALARLGGSDPCARTSRRRP